MNPLTVSPITSTETNSTQPLDPLLIRRDSVYRNYIRAHDVPIGYYVAVIGPSDEVMVFKSYYKAAYTARGMAGVDFFLEQYRGPDASPQFVNVITRSVNILSSYYDEKLCCLMNSSFVPLMDTYKPCFSELLPRIDKPVEDFIDILRFLHTLLLCYVTEHSQVKDRILLLHHSNEMSQNNNKQNHLQMTSVKHIIILDHGDVPECHHTQQLYGLYYFDALSSTSPSKSFYVRNDDINVYRHNYILNKFAPLSPQFNVTRPKHLYSDSSWTNQQALFEVMHVLFPKETFCSQTNYLLLLKEMFQAVSPSKRHEFEDYYAPRICRMNDAYSPDTQEYLKLKRQSVTTRNAINNRAQRLRELQDVRLVTREKVIVANRAEIHASQIRMANQNLDA